MWEKQIRCPNCGYEGKGKIVGPDILHNVIFIIVAVVFIWTVIIPIAYFVWVMKNLKRQVCPKCGFKNVVIK